MEIERKTKKRPTRPHLAEIDQTDRERERETERERERERERARARERAFAEPVEIGRKVMLQGSSPWSLQWPSFGKGCKLIFPL